MSRPALSALRALEILDLLGAAPAQALTLSEIVRLTGTNVASSHAILTVLVKQGYLLRHPTSKVYRLAPAIVALGQAAAEHDGLLSSARAACDLAAQRTGYEAVLTARAGDDIIAVARVAGSGFSQPNFRVGQRVLLRPPMGGLFVAWAPDHDQEAWATPQKSTPEHARTAHLAALALLRERGYLVTLSTDAYSNFTRIIADGDVMPSRRDPRLAEILSELDNGLYQPTAINPADSYRIKGIAAPIFDPHGGVLYALNLNPPPSDDMMGKQLIENVQILLDLCSTVMRENDIVR
jgi:DNA-binding IclR family transcriptional regulator